MVIFSSFFCLCPVITESAHDKHGPFDIFDNLQKHMVLIID